MAARRRRGAPSRSPKGALKRPADFKLIGTPAKRLDTPSKVNVAVYGIDVRPAGREDRYAGAIAGLRRRVRAWMTRRPRAVKGVRQIVRLDDAVAVVADHMGAAKERAGGPGDRMGRRPRTPSSTRKRSSTSSKKATLNPGAVAQNVGNVDSAMASAVTKIEATYQVPFLRNATMEP